MAVRSLGQGGPWVELNTRASASPKHLVAPYKLTGQIGRATATPPGPAQFSLSHPMIAFTEDAKTRRLQPASAAAAYAL